MDSIIQKGIFFIKQFFITLLLIFGKVYDFLGNLSQMEILIISIIGTIVMLIIIYRVMGTMSAVFFLFLFIILYVLYTSNLNSIMDTYTDKKNLRVDKYNEEINKNDLERESKKSTSTLE